MCFQIITSVQIRYNEYQSDCHGNCLLISLHLENCLSINCKGKEYKCNYLEHVIITNDGERWHNNKAKCIN